MPVWDPASLARYHNRRRDSVAGQEDQERLAVALDTAAQRALPASGRQTDT
jgi:hypothetical protein